MPWIYARKLEKRAETLRVTWLGTKRIVTSAHIRLNSSAFLHWAYRTAFQETRITRRGVEPPRQECRSR